MAQLIQISISQGGVPKLPTHQATVTTAGIEGDKQKNLKFHGGPDRAVCIYSLERIMTLQREGHSIWPGATGENFTIFGLDWNLVTPYTQISFGPDLLLEVSDYAVPCQQISDWFNDRKSIRVSQKLHPGWSRVYCRVLQEGVVRPGDRVQIRV
jgi:MOSC domain-containing protein YiiM